MPKLASRLEVLGETGPRFDEVLTTDALEFVAFLHREFDERRRELLALRHERQERFDMGELPDFLPETRIVRESEWEIEPVPAALRDRRVEITGPVDRKMVINALNSGACVFMADFEDANSPAWQNCVEGQINLCDAIAGTISHEGPDGRRYELTGDPATLVVRPRGWHLLEKHVFVDGGPVSASLFDAGLFLFHNAQRLAERGDGPFLYLPKLESHLEARLWNEVFVAAEHHLGLPLGTIKATVLIETITAAFEMDEMLYELRDHAAGLNAGRWDYIFSIIKRFRERPGFVLPDRSQVTMTVPFMQAYCDLLVATCHRRGAHAMGGMSAFIPSRRDKEVNRLAVEQVRGDKRREAEAGFDGTWVAHPDLVGIAREEFDRVLGGRPNQLQRTRDDVRVGPHELVDVSVPGGSVTEAGLRGNVSVGIQYLSAWLRGNGAAAINNLMEDAATAEIARSQVWQWVRHGVQLDDGRTVTAELVRQVVVEELAALRERFGDEVFAASRANDARELFEHVALADEFVEFLTIPAYRYID